MSASRSGQQISRLIDRKVQSLVEGVEIHPYLVPWLRELLTDLAFKSIDITLENATEDIRSGAPQADSPMVQLRRHMTAEGTLANNRARTKK